MHSAAIKDLGFESSVDASLRVELIDYEGDAQVASDDDGKIPQVRSVLDDPGLQRHTLEQLASDFLREYIDKELGQEQASMDKKALLRARCGQESLASERKEAEQMNQDDQLEAHIELSCAEPDDDSAVPENNSDKLTQTLSNVRRLRIAYDKAERDESEGEDDADFDSGTHSASAWSSSPRPRSGLSASPRPSKRTSADADLGDAHVASPRPRKRGRSDDQSVPPLNLRPEPVETGQHAGSRQATPVAGERFGQGGHGCNEQLMLRAVLETAPIRDEMARGFADKVLSGADDIDDLETSSISAVSARWI